MDKVYAICKKDDCVEVQMYGEIVDKRPCDYVTGLPIDGDYIVRDEFLTDLQALDGKCKKLCLRMDSVGGDVGVAIAIHNLLRDFANKGVELTCVVDGVAMSAGSMVMCACDNVKVNATSLVMIHKCGSMLCGYYNADDLRKEAECFDAYDKAIVSAYERKTGLPAVKLIHMMAETTYMTGKEAIANGFADELIDKKKCGECECEDESPFRLSSDGSYLYANGHMLRTYGCPMPPYIKREINAKEITKGRKKVMTLDELKAEYGELVTQIEKDAVTAKATEYEKTVTDKITAMTAEAVRAERNRIREIDEVAALFDAKLVDEAKYGETTCTAQELAYRAAKQAAQQGKNFVRAMQEDTANSGVNEVEATVAPAEQEEQTPEQKLAEMEQLVKSIMHKEA